MENIFNATLICIKSGADMAKAKELMREKRIRHLPVVDHNNNITGILSAHDLTDVVKFQDLPVDLFASAPVKHVSPDTLLSEIALRMVAEKVSCLIISENGKAAGIITTDDLLYELSTLLKEKEKNASPGIYGALTTVGELCKKLADIGI